MENIERNKTLMGFFPEDDTFIVELKFTKDNIDIASKILDCALNNKEILPDLKVEKLYRSIETSDSVLNIKKRQLLNEMSNLMEQFKQDIKDFTLEEIKPSKYGIESIGKN